MIKLGFSIHCKTKTKQIFADFIKKTLLDFKTFQKSNFVRNPIFS